MLKSLGDCLSAPRFHRFATAPIFVVAALRVSIAIAEKTAVGALKRSRAGRGLTPCSGKQMGRSTQPHPEKLS